MKVGGIAVDDLLQRAIERRDLLRDELEAVESFILSYTKAQARQPGGAGSDQFSMFRTDAGKRLKHVAAVRAMVDEAERMIIAEGRPLTRGQLVPRLEMEGHRITGGDKNKVFGTNMWRSGRFWNIKGAGYWPKEREVPAPFAHLPRR